MAHLHNAVDTKLVAILVFLKFFYDVGSQGVNDEFLRWFCKRLESWIDIDTHSAGNPPLPAAYFEVHTGLLELLRLGAVVKISGQYKIIPWAADCLEHDWPWARAFLTPAVLHFMEIGHQERARWEAAQVPEAPQFLERTHDPLNSTRKQP